MANDILLKVAGVHAGYGRTPILQGIDLEIMGGEIVSLIGRNGVGKTTTLRCLMGQLAVSAGQVQFQGKDITSLTPDARARLGIGYVPQGREVFPRLTVEENLFVGRSIGGPQGRKLTDMVYQYFPRLHERARQAAGTMSGGEQQQLAIGRALVGNPALLLLDEPSEGVQPSIVQMICETLKSIRNDLGSTILFVEQNLDTIMTLSQRAYVIEKGRVTSLIGKEQITDREVVRRSLII
ncbi:MAG: ABC transporter ATP-binding protein [Gammaproteobacteria bacterium]